MVRNGISYVPGYARSCSSIQEYAEPSCEDSEEELLWGDILEMVEKASPKGEGRVLILSKTERGGAKVCRIRKASDAADTRDSLQRDISRGAKSHVTRAYVG